MSKDERIVREAWERVDYFEPYDGPGNCLVVIGRVSDETLQRFEGKTKVEAWHAAAEFTIQRQKKIDDVKAEIEELEARVDGCNETLPRLLTDLMKEETMRKLSIWQRILAARQDALAELQRGWKGTK